MAEGKGRRNVKGVAKKGGRVRECDRGGEEMGKGKGMLQGWRRNGEG